MRIKNIGNVDIILIGNLLLFTAFKLEIWDYVFLVHFAT